MNLSVIVPIVEGFSEVESVPLLLRRILGDQELYNIDIAKPVRTSRYKIVKEGELERCIKLARRREKGCNAIVVVIDAEDDCPALLGPELLNRAKDSNADLPCVVVLAKSEFESWFIGSMESLRGIRGISREAISAANPENIRDAKGYISGNMSGTRRYVEVDDQPALTERFDFGSARKNCPSFDKFLRDIDHTLDAL